MTRLWWRRSRKLRREIPHAEHVDVAAHQSSPVWESPVWGALQQLPPRQRAVLVLRYFEDYSERQIAEALACRPGTVKSQASRGIDTLRRLLSSVDEPSPIERGVK
jgi:RNA polymerase sigma factor (sigma-70 family)